MNPNPCPWCDSTAKLTDEDVEGDNGTTTYHFVECESCGARGPCVDRNGNELIEHDAVEKWNEVAP